MEDTDKPPGVESWWGCLHDLFLLKWHDHTPYSFDSCTNFPRTGKFGFSCESWISPSMWVWRDQISALMLSLSPPCCLSQKGCDCLFCQICLQTPLEKKASRSAPLGQALARAVDLFYFFPLNFAEMHSHTSGPSRAASLTCPEGLLLLEIWGLGLAINFIRKASFRPS